MRDIYLALAVVAAGCGNELSDTSDLDGATEEIVENLLQVGYPEAEIEVRDDGAVMVGGDAEVNLEASREMIGLGPTDTPDDSGHFRQYRTYNVVDDAVETICIDGSPLTGVLGAGLDAAILNYNAVGLGFEMVRTNGPEPSCDALIQVIPIPGSGGQAGFPSGGMPYNLVYIGIDVALDGLPVATHVLAHELGHCIGLRHSDYYDRSISCGGWNLNEGEAGVGADHIPGTPTDAVFDGSIMNSCYHSGVTGVFTDSDVDALEELYGVWAMTLWNETFSDSDNWDSGPQYYETIQHPDVDGDGRADACGRGVAGVLCALSSGKAFENVTLWNGSFSDAAGWDSGPEYYGTIRFPDVDGDGRADVCGRGGPGIWCATSTGGSFADIDLWSPAFSDANGWNNGPEYYDTIHFPDVDGDGRDDVCARGDSGILCARSTGAGFEPAQLWANSFKDAQGWNGGPEYYGTIRFPDVDGDGMADVCGRGGGGVLCALSDGSSFSTVSYWTTQFRDAHGWNSGPQYYGTLKFEDINGDSRADICGRGAAGILCALSTGSAFGPASWWTTQFRNQDGGDQPHHYETLTLVDVDADGKADLCGRGVDGMLCNSSTGAHFAAPVLVTDRPSNAGGWQAPQYYRTLAFADVDDDGRPEVCGRDWDGLRCSR